MRDTLLFVLGFLCANFLLTLLLFNGALARPAWILPPDSMVVAKDFISIIQEKKK